MESSSLWVIKPPRGEFYSRNGQTFPSLHGSNQWLTSLSYTIPERGSCETEFSIAEWMRRLLPTLLLLGVAANDADGQIRFEDVAESSGIDFVLSNHPTEHKHLIETMAGGLAVFDFDNDGLIDIFFANGAPPATLEKESARDANRLYRNLGNMKFVDVTAEAGLAGTGYSMSADAADYDNDGDADLFVGGVRHSRLYRNEGDGTFLDVTEEAGIDVNEWVVDAAWLDFDNDGHLDLFVVRYVDWSADFDVYCGDEEAGVRSYCHPRMFKGLPNALYRNRGDGTFEDVSKSSGVGALIGKGMSASVADYDLDGFLDIFVANDKVPNFLFHNRGDGTFEEVGLFVGGALQDHGQPVSSMGSDFRDFDNDGRPDIIFTALAGEGFPLFRATSADLLEDISYASGLAAATRSMSGWGVAFVDLDNDGRKDLFIANGHVNDTVAHFEASEYKLTSAVFQLGAKAKFEDVSAAAGFTAEPARAHRGAGFADFDLDGRIDVVVTSLGERVELWRNTSGGDASWLDVRLVGSTTNRDGIGARVRVGSQWNHMTTSVGYAASSRVPVHFGLGDAKQPVEVEVHWPSGVTQTLKDVAVDQEVEVVEPAR